MIERYTRKEQKEIWSMENRFAKMLQVEKAVAMVQAKHQMIPLKASQSIQKKGRFSVKNILLLEKKTKHDVSAFVKEVSSQVGSPWGKYVHYGLTSSDVLDTALSLQIKESSKFIHQQITQLKHTLKKIIQAHKNTLCAGRTHGMHAELTTFGFKLLGFLSEITRAETQFQNTIENELTGTISGPVGNYSFLSPQIEKEVCQKLNLKVELISTQVIPRDRHARILFSLCIIGSALERLAVELRHLQRTEIAEVQEGFEKNQQGSSSMPHKKNPISSENITGLARLLRSYLQASLENISLWHERDISHSSVERVIFPDAFILCDYALYRMNHVLQHIKINKEMMKKNTDSSEGNIFSSQILLALIQKGVDRQQAYQWIQKASHQGSLKKYIQNTPAKNKLTSKEWQRIFSGEKQSQATSKIIHQKLKSLMKNGVK